MTESAQKDFAIFRRGELRAQILDDWRIGLSTQTNPATSQPWAADEIARALKEGSRWYIEADAIDLVCLMLQARAVFLSEQVRIDHASAEWLEYWCSLWGLSRLSAVGSVGPATCGSNPGTIFHGSTTIGDPLALLATDDTGQSFQLLQTVASDLSSGIASLVFYGLDAGEQTNIKAGTILTWKAPPLGASGNITAGADFTGGIDDENDRDLSRRLVLRIRHKPAAGNRAQFRAWARDASNAIEDAFVYPCAMYSGTVRVAIVQKRGATKGPLARIPNLATLSTATSYLVPPASPVVPSRVLVVVTGVTPVPANFSLSLLMQAGSEAGWIDSKPWPAPDASLGFSSVTTVTDQTHIRITSDTAIPSGNPIPSLMIWNETLSEYEALEVAAVSHVAGTTYAVTLSQVASFTIASGMWISPEAGPAALIGQAVSDYFDSIGPGELVNLSFDERAHRAARFPAPSEEYSSRKTRTVLNYVGDSLGPSLSDSDLLATAGATSQGIPADPILPPLMFVCGKVGVYPES